MYPYIGLCLFIFVMLIPFIGIYLSHKYRTHIDDEFAGGFVFLSILIFVITVVPTLSSIQDHAVDYGQVLKGHEQVEVAQDAIDRINDELSSLKENTPEGSLMNSDTPAKSLIEAKSKYVSRLADAEQEIAHAKVNIAQREAGLFSAVVDWYGKPEIK